MFKLPNCQKEEEEEEPTPLFVNITNVHFLREFLGKVVIMKSSARNIVDGDFVFAYINAYVKDLGVLYYGVTVNRLIPIQESAKVCLICYIGIQDINLDLRHITQREKKFIIDSVEKGTHRFEYCQGIPRSFPIHAEYVPPKPTIEIDAKRGRIITKPFELYPMEPDPCPIVYKSKRNLQAFLNSENYFG